MLKAPIWNEDAEKSVLGSMILSPKAFELVSLSDFYRPSHRAVAEQIEALHHRKM